MLSWIKGSQSDHPLADDKAARALLAELPANDSCKALEELCYWLETLDHAEGMKLPRIVELIDLIDQAAKGHHRKLSQDYLESSARLQKFQEARIWNAVFSFWKQLADAYQMSLTRHQTDADPWGSIKGQIPMIVARATRALALQLKWELLRYGLVAPRVWEQFGRLYAYAEDKGFATVKVSVYPGMFGESMVQRELLKGLMLVISSTDSLLPHKIELVERVIAQFSEFFVLNRQPSKGCHYYVDLALGKPPVRMLSRLQMTPGLRFVGPGDAAPELEKLIAVVEADGVVPSNINLGGQFERELVLQVLRHLARCWSRIPPARAHERRHSVSQISVVHSFDEIVSTVSGKSQDRALGTSTETWTLENESEGGFGALLPGTGADWPKVGTLLGVKLEGGAAWGVGIVRRISAFDEKQRYVGIEVLARGAMVVKLMPVGATSGAAAQDAVLLLSDSHEIIEASEMKLLLRIGGFSTQKSFEMRAYERGYLLVPRELVEAGEDFDMASFRLMQRGT